MSFLVFVSHDFEHGRSWLAGGVDRQSRTGLIFLICDSRGICYSGLFLFLTTVFFPDTNRRNQSCTHLVVV